LRAVVVLSVVAVEQQERQEQAQAVLVELAISLLAELEHQVQEHLLAVVVVVQEFHLLVQMVRVKMAVTAVMVAVVGAVLLLAVLLAQAVVAKSDFITKEKLCR